MNRIRQVLAFGRSTEAAFDVPAALILGIARCSPFNGSNFLTTLGQRLFPTVEIRPSGLGGQSVCIDTSDLGQLISYEEIIVSRCYDLRLVPFTPSVVIDCGAHVGFFSCLAAARYPSARLIAFEPNPVNCQILRRQFVPLEGRMRFHPAAVSVADGKSWFEADESNSGHLTCKPSPNGWQVSVVDFQTVLSGLRQENLLLKMDIEGAEQQVLSACVAVLPKVTALFFETHNGLQARKCLESLLLNEGFTVQWLRIREPFADGFACRT